MDISEGDFVECLVSYEGEGPHLYEGTLYVIEAIGDREEIQLGCGLHGDSCEHGRVKLTSPKVPRKDWWCLGRFSPVYRRNASLFTCEVADELV